MNKLALSSMLTLALLTGARFAQAQAPAPAPAAAAPDTVLGRATREPVAVTGWFVAPTFATTSFDGQLGYSPGMRGGIYLNRRFGIGLTLNGLGTDETRLHDNEARNVGSYGGLLLQYVAASNELVHLTVETTLGSGGWCVIASDAQDGCTGRAFAVFEPMAGAEVNLARHVRLDVGVGYRLAVAGGGDGPSGRDMSGVVGRTALVFGMF